MDYNRLYDLRVLPIARGISLPVLCPNSAGLIHFLASSLSQKLLSALYRALFLYNLLLSTSFLSTSIPLLSLSSPPSSHLPHHLPHVFPYVVPWRSMTVVQYCTATAGWPPVSSIGIRTRRTLQCSGDIFLTALRPDLSQAWAVNPWQCTILVSYPRHQFHLISKIKNNVPQIQAHFLGILE